MMTILEGLFIFIPLLGLMSIPLGLAVIAFDRLLYSSWVPVMRAKMSEQKWPAAIIAIAPLLIFPTIGMLEDYLPAQFVSLLATPWPFVFGGITCIAFSACWLKLPPDDDGEIDEPPARSLTAEWLLAMAILAVNYIGLRVMPDPW